MSYLEKPFKIENCECGLRHVCNIDEVIIETGAVNKLPKLLGDFEKIVLVSDKNTFAVCGERVLKLLKESGKNVKNVVFKGEKEFIANEKAIEELDGLIEDGTQIIVGVGSGSINDLCKYVSFKRDLPCAIVATAPSMDGYASTISALVIDGKKVSPVTHTPKIILADLDVLADAPFEMIKSGVGDIIGKISCLNDWRIANIVIGDVVCKAIYDMVDNEVKACIENIEALTKRDKESIKKLTESLIVMGIAMSYMNNSRPASGSEHHLSHFYEVTGLLYNLPYLPHGIDVGYSTVLTCELRHILLNQSIDSFKDEFDCEKWEKDLHRIYGPTADGLIAFQKGLPIFGNKRFDRIVENWEQIRAILSESPTGEEVEKILAPLGFDMSKFYDTYGKERIKNSIIYAKDIKDKYSLLKLLQDVGLLESFACKITA